jgi:hypothetical protein
MLLGKPALKEAIRLMQGILHERSEREKKPYFTKKTFASTAINRRIGLALAIKLDSRKSFLKLGKRAYDPSN